MPISDELLEIAIVYALQQIPIIGDGKPLTAAKVSHAYDISEGRAKDMLDKLTTQGKARKTNSGYIAGELP